MAETTDLKSVQCGFESHHSYMNHYPYYIERAINDPRMPVDTLVDILDEWLDPFVSLGNLDIMEKYLSDSFTNNQVSSSDYIRKYK